MGQHPAALGYDVPVRKPLFTFVAVLCAAAVLQRFVLHAPPRIFWIVAVIAACALALASRSARAILLPRSRFLCDTCKYDDPRYCSRPERPNATVCPDYCSRG